MEISTILHLVNTLGPPKGLLYNFKGDLSPFIWYE